jgi:hypothetical protein
MPNEKALILQYATGRDGTSDRVFLLSPQEIARYMSDGDTGGSKRLHADKQYIDDESNYLRIAYDMNGKPAWWYLRSPGGKDNLAMCVGDDGAVYISGHGITPEKAGAGGIRPAMMIKYRGEFNNA